MSTNVMIKQEKKFFKKALDCISISEIWNNTCINRYGSKSMPRIGIHDDYFRLDEEFEYLGNGNKANNYILFDRLNMNRGIGLSFNGYNIILRLTHPSVLNEIINFYSLIENICIKIGNSKIYIENENGEYIATDISKKDEFMKNDYNLSYDVLKQSYDKNMKSVCLFCITNPIVINKHILGEIGFDSLNVSNMEIVDNVMNNFCTYLNKLQNSDLYYAEISYFTKNDGTSFGIIPLPPDCPTIFPLDPYNDFNIYKNLGGVSLDNITEFYVITGYNNKNYEIRYSDFISSFDKNTYNYYDANHIIINYSNAMIKDLTDKYGLTNNNF